MSSIETLTSRIGGKSGSRWPKPMGEHLLLLLAFQLAVTACGSPKEATYQAEYLFVDHLDSATVIKKHRRPLSAPYLAIGHDERRVLFQHPPSAYRFSDVPSGPTARFLVAPMMNPQAWEKATDGVGFEAMCLGPSGDWVQLLKLMISPAKKPADRIWHDRDIALDRCSEPTTEIELRTTCGPRRNCGADWAAWGHPRVTHQRTLKPAFDRLAILISVDTLRPDRLSLYGNDRETSPELERLARDAVVFETAVATSPWTIPSHASMLTSTYPRVHGANAHAAISENVPMLAEVVSAAGWQTAGFVDSPYVSSSFGFERGFDHFDDEKAPKGDIRRGALSVRQRLVDWLVEHSEKPAFVFWHLMDVHGPYWGPPPFGGKFRGSVSSSETPDPRLDHLRGFAYHNYLGLHRFSSLEDLVAAYDESIAAADSIMGGLFQLLRDTGLYDDSLIVVTADHGESFLDHGAWVGHGLFLTDDEIRIPLIVKLPGNRHAGTRVREMVGLIDVAPTILDALDVEKPSSFQGISLISPAPGKPKSLPHVAYGFSNNTGASFLRTDSFKYIAPANIELDKILARNLKARHDASVDPIKPLLGEQLYHLRHDAHELASLTEHAGSANQLEKFQAEIARHAAASEARRKGTPEARAPELTEEVKRRLEALGYVD